MYHHDPHDWVYTGRRLVWARNEEKKIPGSCRSIGAAPLRASASHGPAPHGPAPHGPAPHRSAPQGSAPHGPAPHSPAPHGPAPHGSAPSSARTATALPGAHAQRCLRSRQCFACPVPGRGPRACAGRRRGPGRPGPGEVAGPRHERLVEGPR